MLSFFLMTLIITSLSSVLTKITWNLPQWTIGVPALPRLCRTLFDRVGRIQPE